MKKVLITGGSGSIGKAFIKRYYNDYEFHNISRGENLQSELEEEFPKVTNHIASIEDLCAINDIFGEVKPDIVIHLAAMKHIEIVERQPIHGCKINILGSLNIITASRQNNVAITIAISTDKACASESVYGTTKFLMEKCFKEANSDNNKFALCRFANVANSSSSIIPNWQKMKENNIPLKVTDKRMNRMMFSLSDAAGFIHRTIDICKEQGGGFVGVNSDMKTINIYQLAKIISDDIEIIGKRTDVEKFDEDLISVEELPFTKELDGKYVMIFDERQEEKYNLKNAYNTKNAETMTEKEILDLIIED